MTGYRPNSPRPASSTEYFPEPNIYLQSFTLIFSGIAESHIFLQSLDDSFTRVELHTGDPDVNIGVTKVSNSFSVIGTLFLESSYRSSKKALKALSWRALDALVKERQEKKIFPDKCCPARHQFQYDTAKHYSGRFCGHLYWKLWFLF